MWPFVGLERRRSNLVPYAVRQDQKGKRTVALFIGVGMLSICIYIWLGTRAAEAADHSNLEEGLPTELEDAYPVPYLGREVQWVTRYERTDDGKEDRVILEPRVEVGIALNAQVRISGPFFLGSAEKTGSRNLTLEGLYNFNTESLHVPAFSLAARLDFPTGIKSDGVDSTLKFIATKTLGTSYLLHRLHLNAAWKHNAGRQAGERSDLYAIILGYSRRLGPDTMLVTNYVREQEREREKTADILELGIRRMLTPLAVLSMGTGVGIGEDSPDVRVMLGFQYAF